MSNVKTIPSMADEDQVVGVKVCYRADQSFTDWRRKSEMYNHYTRDEINRFNPRPAYFDRVDFINIRDFTTEQNEDIKVAEYSLINTIGPKGGYSAYRGEILLVLPNGDLVEPFIFSPPRQTIWLASKEYDKAWAWNKWRENIDLEFDVIYQAKIFNDKILAWNCFGFDRDCNGEEVDINCTRHNMYDTGIVRSTVQIFPKNLTEEQQHDFVPGARIGGIYLGGDGHAILRQGVVKARVNGVEVPVSLEVIHQV